MAIRLRKINGRMVALCAARSKKKQGDIYLDDSAHHALSVKFEWDFFKEGITGVPSMSDSVFKLMIDCEEEFLVKISRKFKL